MTTLSQNVVRRRKEPSERLDNELVRDIVELLYRYGRRRLRLSAAESDDAVSEFYPSLRKLVYGYLPSRGSFESYVLAFFRVSVLEQRKAEKRRRQIGRMVETGALGYRVVAEEAPISEPAIRRNRVPIFSRHSDSVRRRILCAVCRDAANLSVAEIETYSRELSLPDGWLEGVSGWARNELSRNFDRIERLRGLRDVYYARLIQSQTELEEVSSCERRIALLRKVEVNRLRLKRTREKLLRISTQLSHRQLSELLGIPKGSIDSNFAVLRRTLAKELPPEIRSMHEDHTRQQ